MRLHLCFVSVASLFVVVCNWSTTAWSQSPGFQLTEKTRAVFATVEQGQSLLTKDDAFLQRIQPLEIQIRLGQSEPISKEEYANSLASGVQTWQPNEVASLEKSLEVLKQKFSTYHLHFPSEVQLVRVAPSVEANLPHCRGSAIVIPDGFFGTQAQMTKVLAHELFHVLSSHNPKLRDELYGIIGFKRCEEIELPGVLGKRRLTNPDAPSHEHYITLKVEGQARETAVTPITITKTSSFNNNGLMGNLDFRLLELEEKEGDFQAKIVDNKPVLFSPREVPDFLRKIGRNTNYIIHPEETLADNFWMLVLESPAIKDRWVTDAMQKVLTSDSVQVK